MMDCKTVLGNMFTGRICRFIILRLVGSTTILPEILRITQERDRVVPDRRYKLSSLGRFDMPWRIKLGNKFTAKKMKRHGCLLLVIEIIALVGKRFEYFFYCEKININRFAKVLMEGGGANAIFLTYEKEVIPA